MTLSLFTNITPSILIVDDDEVIRLFLRQFLEGEGYHVAEAADGEEGLKKIAEKEFDLVILDIAMPGLEGPTVCERINTLYSHPPPVLMVTALDNEQVVDRSFGAGAMDYICKPIHWAVLRNRIKYILEAHWARRELEEMTRNYELILDSAANGICGVDGDKLISYINPAALEMLEYSKEEVLGRSYKEIFKISRPGQDDFEFDCCPFFEKNECNCTKEPLHHDEMRLLKKSGVAFPVDCRVTPIFSNGKVCGGVMVFQDVTERQQAASLIRYMANHDSLTSLPNRNYFRKRLPQAISLAKRNKRILCLLFIDLDRFKPINDTYGHAVGDEVLIRVSERLTAMLRSSDSICRLGGDEFVILLESTHSAQGCEMVAEKAISLLNEPIEVNEHICNIGASVGISIFPDDCSDAETMLRNADIAMYRAKKKGRNTYELFSGDKK
ncbi:MAG: diguanylate cyclase [Desulfobulbaceae bacterium]|nr:diguanylate cyclase [Desulfobulbaceae bacterium]